MLKFKRADASQAALVSDLVNSAYRGESSQKGWTTEAHLLAGQRTDAEEIIHTITSPNCEIELGFEDEELVACVLLKKTSNESCYLGMLTVSPQKQARGAGKLLLAHAEEIARSWNCKKMVMTVIDRRPELLEFYQRRGYRITGNSEDFPSHQHRLWEPKVPDLKLIELEKFL